MRAGFVKQARKLLFTTLAVLFLTAAQAFATCTNPNGNEGDIIYAAINHTMAYCNSSNWIAMGANMSVNFGTLTTNDFCTATSGTAIACTTGSVGSGSVVLATSPTITTPTFSGTVTGGTFAGGTWNGGLITGTYGGTGVNNGSNTITVGGNMSTAGALSLPTVAQGDLWYGSAAGTISALAKNTTASTYLSNTGASNNPAWAQVNLANGVTGNLPNANLASQTANTVLGALTATTPSGLNMPSCSTGTSALTWTSGTGFGCNSIAAGLPALAANDIWIGNGSNVATAVALGGDCTLTYAGGIVCTKTGGVSFGALAVLSAAPAGTLTGTTLAANVVNSSLTGVGTISAGVWQGTLISPTYGGTGVSNPTAGVIYMGQGASAMTPSALSDNGTIVSTTENIDLTSNAEVTEIANASATGTTMNLLAKLTGAPSTAVKTATTDTGGIIGIVTGNAGTSGNAQVAMDGQAACTFDGATTAGDFVTISSTNDGYCHDDQPASIQRRPVTRGNALRGETRTLLAAHLFEPYPVGARRFRPTNAARPGLC